MLQLDFINVGNGDSILIREMEGTRQRFAMLVDCGHDNLVRDDHPPLSDQSSRRIYAGDFLRKQGVEKLDLLLLTHFHRDHIGGLGRILEAVEVEQLAATYVPPAGAPPLEPDRDLTLHKTARNLLRCLEIYAAALREHPGRVKHVTVLPGTEQMTLQLTEDLSMDILFGDPFRYKRQRQVYDAAFAGERECYPLMKWSKMMNVSSLRQRLHYKGRDVVLGGDTYAHLWEADTLAPCEVLKVPHNASLSSTTRKLIAQLRPQTAVVCVASERPDERPHPYIVSLLQEMVPQVYFTDAVHLPGLVEPAYHESVTVCLD